MAKALPCAMLQLPNLRKYGNNISIHGTPGGGDNPVLEKQILLTISLLLKPRSHLLNVLR